MHPPPLPLPPIYPLDVSLSLSLSTTDIGVNVGLSGNRSVVCLVFCEHRSIRHMILELQRRLSPEFDDKDIKFVHETTMLKMHVSPAEAGLKAGAVVQALIFEPWTLKVQRKHHTSSRCECRQDCGRPIWGTNFTINVDSLKPGFTKGQPQYLGELISLSKQPIINEGDMNAADFADLVSRSKFDTLWSCTICSKIIFTCTNDVPPGWCLSNSKRSYCYLCYVTYVCANLKSRALSRMDWTACESWSMTQLVGDLQD